jgi:threonine/homoserine/homoserine lactone efflux protein
LVPIRTRLLSIPISLKREAMIKTGDAILFIGMATGLLGSPGPGIAALVATGRERGFIRSLPFYMSMQLGLLAALVICALGLSRFILVMPRAAFALTLVAAAYLVYLGVKIALAPVGHDTPSDDTEDFRWLGGFLLGAANPKAYIAFLGLLGSAAVAGSLGSGADLIAKIVISICVTLAVDAAWLSIGVGLGLIALSTTYERVLNLTFGILLIITAALTLF